MPEDDKQQLKEALTEAMEYLESDDRCYQGDLAGCAVPATKYHKWLKLIKKEA